MLGDLFGVGERLPFQRFGRIDLVDPAQLLRFVGGDEAVLEEQFLGLARAQVPGGVEVLGVRRQEECVVGGEDQVH